MPGLPIPRPVMPGLPIPRPVMPGLPIPRPVMPGLPMPRCPASRLLIHCAFTLGALTPRPVTPVMRRP